LNGLAYLGVGAAALGAVRWWYPRAVERRLAARFPVGADGIIPGAAPILLEGTGTRGILIIHGFGDTPQSVETLARALHAGGETVYAPLLAGHGRTLAEFARSGGGEWLARARQALQQLRGRCTHLAVVGQSLGGVLATLLVTESTDITALALLAPYLEMPRFARSVTPFAAWLEPVLPYLVTADARSVHDAAARARSLSFGTTTLRLTRELRLMSDRARAALPDLKVPTLYIQAREDNRIESAVAERSFDAIGAREKRLVWLERGGHVVAADEERDRVAQLVAEWLAAR
jgi:carboxylesterase